MAESKYNPNRYGKSQNKTRLRSPKSFNSQGLFLQYGNGCTLHPNCFECPEPPNKCRYGGNVISQDRIDSMNMNLNTQKGAI